MSFAHPIDTVPALITANIPSFVALILERLQESGYQAFVVGGAIRNAYLNRPIVDWDVATSASPEEIKSVFKDERFFALKHGTVTLVSSRQQVEITSFRGNGTSLEDDLSCRDFTINAMAFDPEKSEIDDPHGGRSDIRNKVIRAVGDPTARFLEDPLRLLRAVRLATELWFRIDKRTLEALPELAPLLLKVAPERIREELVKILMGPKPSLGFNLMRRTGLLEQVLPELIEGVLKRQNHHHRHTIYKHIMETTDRVDATPVSRLTALFHDIAKPRVREKIKGRWRFLGHEDASAELAVEIMNKFRFSRHMIEKVAFLIRHHVIGYRPQWSDAAVRRLIRRVGKENIMDLIRFRRADVLAHGLGHPEEALLCELDKRIKVQLEKSLPVDKRDLAINGDTVMEVLALKQGPQVGKILSELTEKVTDHPHLNTDNQLISLLKKMKQTESA